MAIEERDIKDLTEAYDLVVKPLSDDRAKCSSVWNPSLKKANKEPKQADLADKPTEVSRASMAASKPAPRYNNGSLSGIFSLTTLI
ncbi:hypothetical protein DSO57_1028432 [Entomophthora muscae]|uniref:Uncharacterized protein n=1 Tax=Entomophthora muscae TaxID=34485 RepID=A0ACC2TNQ2_9FUNG|nr:hypothetical protein DSO57_1028432 [Entomophthora muscae]